MESMNMKDIRTTFLREFAARADDRGIRLEPAWFPPPFDDDEIMANWISKKKMRVMRVQEVPVGDELDFGYALGRTGEHDDYDDLLIVTRDTHMRAKEILEFYIHWFVEERSAEDMERILDSHTTPHGNQ